MTTVFLKKGREESLKRFHPWIFSGAVASVSGTPYEGEVVEVVSSERNFLAYGHYQKGSIIVRVLTFSQDYHPSTDGRMPLEFWEDRISRALALRRVLEFPSHGTDCFRLVHGEGDSLPGLVVDIYKDVAVLQAHSAGMYISVDLIAEAIMRCCGDMVKAVYNKSAATAPHKAGLDRTVMSRLRRKVTRGRSARTAICSMSTGHQDRRPVSFWIREITVSWWASTQKGGRSLIYSVIQEDSLCMP